MPHYERMRTTAMGVLALALMLGGCDDGDGEGDDDAGPGETDAGPGAVDAGPGGEVDSGAPDAGGFDVGSCTAAAASIRPSCSFTPCGGDLEGSWCYTGVCIQQDQLFGGFMGCAANDVDWRGVTGTVTGRVRFDGTRVRRVVTTELSGTVSIPPSCVPIPGICGGTVSMALSTALEPDGTASCADAPAGGCVCDVSLTIGVDAGDTYGVNGNQFETDGRTFDYCVEMDGSLNLREAGASPEEPALQTFAPE